MKKLFVSQPMNGKSEAEIRDTRRLAVKAAEEYLGEEVEVLDSHFNIEINNGCVPLKYLAMSIYLLSEADLAYFADGWESARGCLIERECAIKYGIDFIDSHVVFKKR